jgi:hypothetical protein
VARYPKAAWLPIPENATQPHRVPTQFILHTAVMLHSPRSVWLRSGVESTGWLAIDGKSEQYLDSMVRADANYDANRTAISWESADHGDPDHEPWTDAQVEEWAHILLWAHNAHGIPLRACTSATGSGIGYHAQFHAWNKSNHSCPGAARIRQVPGIIARAVELSKPTPPVVLTYLEKLMATTEASLAAAIASALLGSEVAPGVSVADALRRLEEDAIRGNVRRVYEMRLAAAIGAGDLVEARRALKDMESTRFPGEGSAIGEPLTGPGPIRTGLGAVDPGE